MGCLVSHRVIVPQRPQSHSPCCREVGWQNQKPLVQNLSFFAVCSCFYGFLFATWGPSYSSRLQFAFPPKGTSRKMQQTGGFQVAFESRVSKHLPHPGGKAPGSWEELKSSGAAKARLRGLEESCWVLA